MSANLLAKCGVDPRNVPDRAMCEDLLEQLILDTNAAGMKPRQFEPSPEMSLRCETVITWLQERRWLTRREQQEVLEEPSITAAIGQRCWEALGEPTHEQWHARLKGV